jgi:competence protein CoiA
MPLRCRDLAGRSIQAFDLADEQWRALEVENRRVRHLKMLCCSAQVTLKRSRLGTRFFAHKAVGACTAAAETEAHLRLKAMAVEEARAHGWSATTEVLGISPSGEAWRADVLAEKGDRKIAIEIQWSTATNNEILRRQERYREAEVRGLWLLRQPSFPITRELPAARIGGSPGQGFAALIPSGSAHQALPLREFLNAVFSRRFRFGVPVGAEATVSVRAGCFWCWSCGAETTLITGIDVVFGPTKLSFTVPELGEHAKPLENVRSRLPRDLKIGSIKRRFSRKQGRGYVSNGCFHCGALIGEYFEHDAWDEQETVLAFSIQISEQWKKAIESHAGYEKTWGVYSLLGRTV